MGVLKPNRLSECDFLGRVLALMLASDLHRGFTLDDIKAMILPAYRLEFYRLYCHADGTPFGFVSWATLDSRLASAFLSGRIKWINPKSWDSGANIVIMDFIAPYGHVKQMVRDLSHHIFPNEVGWALRFKRVGIPRSVMRLHGKNATPKAGSRF